ncbi:hypothetical protein [Pseudomonas paraversuta]|uniref:hypothetical protein n=1 Tax=Pseudomonas paraversuta TaxID=2750624 RepID=UPI00192490BC|nr:hypothetical protein [Pseudomonas paraversuta]
MPLTKPSQEIRARLIKLGVELEQAADEALSLAHKYQGAELIETLKMITKLYENIERLKVISEDLKSRDLSD